MSALAFDRPPAESLGALLQAEMSEAAALARDEAEAPDKRVHAARKQVKKLRAVLRLARPALPRHAAADDALRDAAAELSGLRDSHVYLKTLDWLQDRHPGRLAGPASVLRAHFTRTAPDSATERDRLARFGDAITAIAADSALWEMAPAGWTVLATGARKTYRRGRRALKTTRKTEGAADFHNLRKQVKYRGNQMELLKDLPGLPTRTEREALFDLGEELGRHHDLEALLLRTRQDAILNEEALAALSGAIERAQAKLGERILAAAGPVYARRPKRLRALLRDSLKAAGGGQAGAR